MYDVVIVGAGPVGLFLACELGLAGSSVLVLEQEARPGSVWRAMPLGFRGLSVASADAFHRRGMLRDLLVASGAGDYPVADPDADEAAPPARVGHFAGVPLDPGRIDIAALPFRLPGPAMEPVGTSLEAVEGVLSERAAKLGVEIRRGVTVSAVTQADGHVVAHAGDETYAARWLVGCDGGRSTVRKQAGFDFVGTEPRLTGYSMLATVADPEKLRPGFNPMPTGMYLRALAPGHLAVMELDGGAFDRSRPPGREHLQAVLRRVSGTDVTLSEVHFASTYTDRAKQPTTYRRGRVLLAGDAAHIHSPIGGQGLNVGIGDALNLGWKLAATLRGDAPEGLLDSYTRERHPVGAWVLDWTRVQVATMSPDAHGRAVKALVHDLLGTRDGTTYAYEKLSGSGLRYDLGDDHPLAGRLAPELRLVDGTRLGDLLREGRGVVLDFTPERRLREAANGLDERVLYAAGPARDDLGLDAVLVRPDGIVAWAGERGFEQAAFERAAGRWFGCAAV
ncbi:FAD-dependent monooxygenase [Streptomyces sp. NRRL F-5126]|uniref:FAD-dependent monooxygenase n=1 Tax=Streptomyces sp. NRRL F-5126 TaxID=1463857 RepID=UPI0004C73943|nr:FAD-dependent monooxygenase [Streptomyces sp. NRRL F-5126]